jgi:hypothetical protein
MSDKTVAEKMYIKPGMEIGFLMRRMKAVHPAILISTVIQLIKMDPNSI